MAFFYARKAVGCFVIVRSTEPERSEDLFRRKRCSELHLFGVRLEKREKHA